jgi:NAD(P)H-dependent nitrite reductase small subunit
MAYLDSGVKSSDLASNTTLCVTMGEVQVGLFRTSDALFAIDNVCPHRGAPLHDGFVHDGAVTCPWHQWDFRLSDGECLNVPKVHVKSYAVEDREGSIWIDLEETKGEA